MFLRVVLAGFALASLIVPAAAWARSRPAPVTSESGLSGDWTAEAAAEPAARSGRRRRLASIGDAAVVLPPPKPEAFGGSSATEGASILPFNPFGSFSLRSADPAAGQAVAAVPAAAAAEPSTNPFATLFGAAPAQPRGEALPPLAGRSQIDALISHHAKLNGVPEALVHRIVVRESKYNPRAVGRGGAMGLMQIKTGTARALGYQGGPMGLLDAETNITYAVKYLAGAYRTAGGDHDLAVSHYARGYYYAARRQGLVETASYGTGSRRSGRGRREAEATPVVPAQPESPSLMSLFAPRSASAAPPAIDRAAR